ncbi:hypothetical protein ACFFRR_002306 [Megaselia abdita]
MKFIICSVTLMGLLSPCFGNPLLDEVPIVGDILDPVGQFATTINVTVATVNDMSVAFANMINCDGACDSNLETLNNTTDILRSKLSALKEYALSHITTAKERQCLYLFLREATMTLSTDLEQIKCGDQILPRCMFITVYPFLAMFPYLCYLLHPVLCVIKEVVEECLLSDVTYLMCDCEFDKFIDILLGIPIFCYANEVMIAGCQVLVNIAISWANGTCTTAIGLPHAEACEKLCCHMLCLGVALVVVNRCKLVWDLVVPLILPKFPCLN